MGVVRSLYFYPFTGLSPQPLESVRLEAGGGFPFDRLFAVAKGCSGAGAPRSDDRLFTTWQGSGREELFRFWRGTEHVRLKTSLDPVTRVFTIRRDGEIVHESDMSCQAGIDAVAAFFARMYGLGSDAALTVVNAGSDRFTENPVSLINLDTVADLARRAGQPVNPMRFRANIYFDGWPAMSELEMIGKEFSIGSVRVRATLRTQRCVVTTVNPETAERDLFVPRLLMDHYGHPDLGIYAEVLDGGSIRPGDEITSK